MPRLTVFAGAMAAAVVFQLSNLRATTSDAARARPNWRTRDDRSGEKGSCCSDRQRRGKTLPPGLCGRRSKR